jgi:DNA-binding transcriptional regulator LsrR (DeoR family)
MPPIHNSEKTPTPQQRYFAIAAAFLLAQGKSRAEIAAKLKRSEPEVAKLIGLAKELGYLSRAPAFLRYHVNNADWREVERHFFGEASFTSALQTLLPPNVPFEAHVMLGNYNEFIHAAAIYVGHLLRLANRLGLMWGRTVHLLVENIKACGEHLDRDALNRIECVPLCGDPIHLMNQREIEYSASWLAVELERALRGKAKYREEFPCLIGVPAYLSRAVRAGARSDGGNWVSFVHQIPGYETIFGRKPGQRFRLADEVDTIIMGAGIIGPDSGPWKPSQPREPSTGDFIQERLQQEQDVSNERLARLIFGDVGGLLLERPGLNREDRQLVDELNRGWTGLQIADLQRIAKATHKNGKPGIILIAAGDAKAEVLHAAIKLGLVNQLVVDVPLKDRLLALAANGAT